MLRLHFILIFLQKHIYSCRTTRPLHDLQFIRFSFDDPVASRQGQISFDRFFASYCFIPVGKNLCSLT